MTRVVSPGFRDRVAEAVRRIPAGRVATYGDVAAVLGSPRVARHVGWALSALPAGTDVPWHRVVNARGRISGRGDLLRVEEQAHRLREEGIDVDDEGRLALRSHRWDWVD